MKRNIISTADGSPTVEIPGMNVTYHSRHGAVQESEHVFIRAGLHYWREMHPGASQCRLLEMGLGTGLNAWLTAREAAALSLPLHYTALEAYPLSVEEAAQLNYGDPGTGGLLQEIHAVPWEQEVCLRPGFFLHKLQQKIEDFTPAEKIDLVYYDAFAPATQPELWTEPVFRKLFEAMDPGGTLVTYCAKGDVRRALQAAGFTVTRLPGPPGKREMLRGTRIFV